ncbi:HET-domain-containing protein [Apiospora saccharicola]|uniref:HET-domain-containing protein n=1 Tax=Apiospora saccharicola TaxID=335842 RepID=A0ABR1TJD5_9PEZI
MDASYALAATLQGVMSNTACPLCRLIKHILHAHGDNHDEEGDPAKISISPTDLPFTIDLEVIQVIDVRDRCLRVFDPKLIKYAPLSYVWGEAGDEHRKLFETLQTKADGGGDISTSLTSRVPGIIEEAMMVCERLSISYLWVDLLCIHQTDSGKKAAEIKAMGYIYHLSHITIVAGSSSPNGAHLAPTTVPTQEKHQLDSRQRIETIGNRQYITSLPSIGDQNDSLSGGLRYRISVRCWPLEGIPTFWGKKWRFEDYASIMFAYSQRNLSYESDRLNAISGCLNVLAQSQGIHIVMGLRTVDFRYALLWSLGKFDRRREGFPSWSWAGWYTRNQSHYMYPYKESSSGTLISTMDGTYSYQSLDTKAIELDGLLLNSGMEGAHRTNKCAQKLARLSVSEVSGILTVESEVARFFIDIKPGPSPLDDDSASEEGWESPPKEGDHVKVPSWFESTKGE